MTDMTVSVIVPVYNCEAYLETCVDSLLNQDHSALEIILVDDGATDGSGTICDAYAEKHPQVQVYHQPNRGAAAARRTGLAKAAGEYVMFVDSDDWVDPDLVSSLLKPAASYDADMVVSSLRFHYGEKVRIDHQYFPTGFYDRHRLTKILFPNALSAPPFHTFGISPSMCGKLFRRTLAEANAEALNTGIRLGEDACFTYSVLLDCRGVYLSDCSGYGYRQNPESVTHRFHPALLTEGEKLRSFFLDMAERKKWDAGNQIEAYIAYVCAGVTCSALTSSYMKTPGAKQTVRNYLDALLPKEFGSRKEDYVTSPKIKMKLLLMHRRALSALSLLLRMNRMVNE